MSVKAVVVCHTIKDLEDNAAMDSEACSADYLEVPCQW